MTPDELTKLQNSIKHLLELAAKRDAEAAKNEARFERIAKIFQTEHDSIKRLERIAVAQEARLSRLEKRKRRNNP